ncbi:MAG: hypothetical protein AB7O44_26445 [Hyphomicrobiaceae bacterium]
MTRTASSLTTAPGCGCGGACGGNCSCGNAGGGRLREGALQRPRFFAGQLLTQEDLALIVDHAVGKARLRNRLLFGEGVVCGLTVTCPPCGDGTVVVSPGYALDCCGNDIHLPCPEEVNINRLVRELRLRQLDGWDCGDPCEVKRCEDKKDTGKDGRGKGMPTYRYCLYIRYREVAAEPVAPYISDAECGQVACEATRIVETYEFELRCGGEKRTPADLFAAFTACLGDLRQATETTKRAQTGQAMAAQLASSTAWLRTGAAPTFTPEDADALEGAMQEVERLAAFEAAGVAPPQEADFRRMLASLEVAAAAIARLRALDETGRKAALDNLAGRAGLQAALRGAPDLMAKARRAVTRLSGELLQDALSREAALGLAELAERHASNPFAAAPETDEFRMLMSGASVSGQQLARLRVDAAQLRNYLQERLARSTRLTSCDLLDRLHQVRLGEGGGTTIGEAERVSGAVEELVAILIEYLRDCFCLALNPPCAPPCDDSGVLLACLEVRDCEVVEICNMSRRFVLSPSALRYWLPPLGTLGMLLERVCCGLEIPRHLPQQTAPAKPALVRDDSYFLRGGAPRAELDGSVAQAFEAVGLQPEVVTRFVDMLGNLAALAPRGVPDIGSLAQRLSNIVPRPLRPEPAVSATEAKRMLEAARDEMRATARDEAAAAREAAMREAARLAENTARMADEARDRIATETRRALETELTPERLAAHIRATNAVAELQAQNARLEAEVKRFEAAQAEIKELSEQLADLKKQVDRQADTPRSSRGQPRS